ncbi:MAG: 2-isopropylmalate synthase [Acidobacteria bacterium]|nr:2-isopropylmalate synthase [Acidobacteriota bacterium]
MSDRIYIFDTTLRDGEQSPGCSLTIEEKLQMARQLERLQVDVIEAGFPISSDGDFESVRAIAREIRSATIAGLCRTIKKDIDRVWEAVQYATRPRIHTFIATSDIHLKYKLRKTREQVLEDAVTAVSYARSLCPDVEFSAEDASRTEMDYLVQVVEAVIEAGATVVNIPDTVGYAIPWEFAEKVRTLISRVRNADRVTFSVHCHNDLGLSTANSLAAVAAGARQVECTVNGIGERGGNASLEEVVMAVRTRKDIFDGYTRVKTEEIYPSSRLLSNLTGVHVQANKAIVGRNAFAHESGIHQDGVIKEKLTYEIMTPQSVGIKESNLVLGKHSGRHALAKKYEELGYGLNPKELDKAYLLFKKLADRKKEIYDEDLIVIIQDGIRVTPEVYKLKYVQASSGNQIISTATIILEKGDLVLQDSATGDGPIEATMRAIDRVTGIRGHLVDYTVHSVSGGKDAVAEVFVRVKFDDRNFIGKAASTDLVDASARAYLHAVNKAVYWQSAAPKSVAAEDAAAAH